MYGDVAGADLFAPPAIGTQCCPFRDIYIRDLFTGCSECQQSDGARKHLGLFFVSGTYRHAAQALDTVIEPHDPVDLVHRNRAETFTFVPFSLNARKTLRDTLVNVTSIDHQILDGMAQSSFWQGSKKLSRTNHSSMLI